MPRRDKCSLEIDHVGQVDQDRVTKGAHVSMKDGMEVISDLDFYAHVATRGDVLGLGIGTQPAQWETGLGTDHLDTEDGGLLRRDYGLVELSFQEENSFWPCFGVSVQVHRLRWDTVAGGPARRVRRLRRLDALGGPGRRDRPAGLLGRT
ncbi:hypothetical protein [Streptomyces sp. Amel2xC10]|uniref:hypothetical protein n=1 Tax=Streptomyces sp. Amel2xC10 TaxID=1305826 RepID=UPI000A08AAD7|nr:hypothetical protein [Streptomyces sp. Amel2xC10]SMF84732.1 hypothetical protein SAMN02745830_06867 [Streptomyces sp. Amel2xC10]